MSLTDAVKISAGRPAPGIKPSGRRRRTSLTASVKKVASHRRNPPATRTDRKGVVIYFDRHVALAIRRLASNYETTNQALGEMAFKYLFEKFGEPWPA
jgi:hypothetical protein